MCSAIEDMRVKYINSDAVLFLKKNNKLFVEPILPYWMSSLLVLSLVLSSMEKRRKMIAFAKLRYNALERSFSSDH